MTPTKEEKIEILAQGDDLLERLYSDSEAALNAAWKKHEQQQSTASNGHARGVDHPEDVLVDDDRPDEWRDEDEAVERICSEIGILEAWERWSGKSKREEVMGRREGIKVSCPVPGHVDENPSCWINLDKKTWFCGRCDIGGDIFDIAANYFGYPVPGYKEGKNFPDLRRDMAADLGYTFTKTRGGNIIVNEPEIEDDDQADIVSDEAEDHTSSAPDTTGPGEVTEPTPQPDPVEPEAGSATPASGSSSSVLDDDVVELPGPDLEDLGDPLADDDDTAAEPPPTTRSDPPPTPAVPLVEDSTVTYLFGEPEPNPPEIDMEELRLKPLFIDWQAMKLEGTFIGDYMAGTCVDHVPDEYNFWMALQCLGFATQMNVLGVDPMGFIKPGIFVVLYGGTGIGKTRSMSPMHQILKSVLPWPDMENGVLRIGTPGSGEALIDATTHKELVASGTTPTEIEPTNIWLNNDEFGSLTAIANRKGSTLKTVLMEMHDLTKGTSKDSVSITSRTHGTVKARDKNFQVTSSVQPKIIGRYTADTDIMSGFLNRWVFAMGHLRRKPIAVPPYKDVASATTRLAEIRDWASVERNLEMTEDAKLAWEAFYEDQIAPAVERSANVESASDLNDGFMARIELLIKKLCLFFAINEQSDVIDVRHVELGTSLSPYVNATMIRLNGDFVWNFATEVEEAIIEYLARKPSEPRKMAQINNTMAKRFRRGDINKAMQTLIDLGVIEEVIIKSKRGPSSTKYRLVEVGA